MKFLELLRPQENISGCLLVRPAVWFLSHVDVTLANFLEHSIKHYNNDILEASKLLCLWLLQERFRRDFTVAVGCEFVSVVTEGYVSSGLKFN